jgi:hypothetical protein
VAHLSQPGPLCSGHGALPELLQERLHRHDLDPAGQLAPLGFVADDDASSDLGMVFGEGAQAAQVLGADLAGTSEEETLRRSLGEGQGSWKHRFRLSG